MALNFLKTGAASAQLAQKAAAEAEQRKQEQGKLFRFYLRDKEEGRITFIDGDLNPEGFLVPPRYYEHNMFQNGQWGNLFVCPEKTTPGANEKCPLCESGDRPTLVALFTIIDHREIPSTKDKNKVWKNTKRLFVAKPQTFELLNRQAVKRGGLAGAMFEAARVGDKAAAVGSQFDFVEKKSIEELQKIYVVEKIDPKTNVKTMVTNFVPADYEHEIVYRTGDQLREFLKLTGPVTGQATTPAPAAGTPVDYAKEL